MTTLCLLYSCFYDDSVKRTELIFSNVFHASCPSYKDNLKCRAYLGRIREPSVGVLAPNTCLSEDMLGINSYHWSSRTLLWNTLFHKITSGYTTLNCGGKMPLLQPPESKIKAAVKLHYDGASTVRKANLEPFSHLWGVKEGDMGGRASKTGRSERRMRDTSCGKQIWFCFTISSVYPFREIFARKSLSHCKYDVDFFSGQEHFYWAYCLDRKWKRSSHFCWKIQVRR